MLKVNELNQVTSSKRITLEESATKIKELKEQGKKVGLCHGGFDLLHPGHILHFSAAKKSCDILFVSVTSDEFVTSRKGQGRPIFTDQLRAYAIANLAVVDFVVVTNFAKGVEVIEKLQPSFYIKGPDFINKTTPGIMAEREAIKEVGGEMVYTTEYKMSTTAVLNYVKKELKGSQILVVLDRDHTLITGDSDWPGKENDWQTRLQLNQPVVSFLSYLQTKYKTTKLVISNQSGVARGYFDTGRVEEINQHFSSKLKEKGVFISSWNYCPDVDADYALRSGLNFIPRYVKEFTERKPNISLVVKALTNLGKSLKDFDRIVVLGDRHEDAGLATNLQATFIDVKEKTYEDLLQEFN